MAVLVDTSILARLANTADAYHTVADRAVLELHRRGDLLHISPQNVIELRAVATRPIAANGLGLDIAVTEAKTVIFETAFSLLTETPDIFPIWKSIVAAAGVIGKRVHDARLVAICHVHGVDSLMTFNVQDFAGLGTIAPGLIIIDPASV